MHTNLSLSASSSGLINNSIHQELPASSEQRNLRIQLFIDVNKRTLAGSHTILLRLPFLASIWTLTKVVDNKFSPQVSYSRC